MWDTDCPAEGVTSAILIIDFDRAFATKCVVVTAIDYGGCILYVVTASCESGSFVTAGVGDVI